MSTIKRSLVLGGLLAVAGGLGWNARSAQAQTPGTYADFPFQQGSAFYQYRGNTLSNPNAVGRTAYRYTVPATTYAPPTPATVRPAQTYTYTTVPGSPYKYYYDYRARRWYYYR